MIRANTRWPPSIGCPAGTASCAPPRRLAPDADAAIAALVALVAQARAAARAHDDGVTLLRERIRAPWPAAAGGFPWHWLVDPENAEGPARFDRQYWRANVDPAERCALSIPGSTAWRLATDGTGVAHFCLAGDWLKTGLDCGCVEAAVMGGMQAARAISAARRRSWATAAACSDGV